MHISVGVYVCAYIFLYIFLSILYTKYLISYEYFGNYLIENDEQVV